MTTPAGLTTSGGTFSWLPEEWKVSEVGDGNLNMVFIVEGTHKTIIVKQALPWLRAGGEGWPLSLSRAGFEYNVLCQEAKYAGHTLIPQVYFYDPEMALFAMEYLTPHVILRKELINGKKFPKLAEDIGRFLAQTLFNTSDIGMSAEQKKALTAEFALNHELCKITEDLIFTEPYYNAERNSGDGKAVEIIDQTKLPFKFEVVALTSAEMAATAIQDMWVRGAPLIGVVAAYGIALGMNHDASDMGLQRYYDLLIKTRPTAINLKWALDRMIDTLKDLCVSERKDVAWALAAEIAEEDVALCEQIGLHGAEVIREIAQKKPAGSVVNILTHCNAGWLATVDWGTALSPIYKAHENGIPVHVWVDETRPRNQGGLTAFELGSHGIPHTLIADNAGGHLMQHGDVDLCIVGTDRTTARGDVCNKIGTYLKALAAHDNHVPFYVALPSPTIDWTIEDGKSIPIEQRDGKEQSHVYGINPQGELSWVNTAPEGTRCGNYAFDVTPARYITGFITERGVCAASKSALADMFADLKSKALQGEQH